MIASTQILGSGLIGLLAAAGWGTSDYLAAHASRKHSVAWAALMTQVVGIVVMGAIALFAGHPPNITFSDISLLISGSLMYTLALLLFYYCFTIGSISLTSAIVGAYSLVSVPIAVIFFREHLNIAQIAASIMIVAGLVAITLRTGSKASTRGLVCAFGAMLLWGISIPMLKPVALHTGWVWLTLFMCILRTAWTVLLQFKVLKREYQPVQLRSPVLVGAALSQLGGNIALHIGLTFGLVAIIAPTSSVGPLFAIIPAVVFLHERLTRQQVLGLIGVLAGVAVIAS